MKVQKKAHQTSKEIKGKNHKGDQKRELNPKTRLFTAKIMGRIRFDEFDHDSTSKDNINKIVLRPKQTKDVTT
jgi:hypothetical protein